MLGARLVPATLPASRKEDGHYIREFSKKDGSMVSTYASYNSVVRNLQQSLTRVAQQADVTRSAAYYKENIGKIKTVDEFLKNDRLYQYAMKAYGLEDMIYAKAFMKKVLESNLLDANSFANKLTDKRFRDFASAFSFTGSDTPAAQSSNQTDEMIGLYTASVQKRVDAIDEDTNYYNIVIGRVKNVDELLNDDRLRTYVFEAFGIDDSNWSRDTIRKVLSSDPSDPNSYVNTVWGPQKDAINAKLGQAQAVAADANAKIAQYMSQLSQPGADVPGLRAKITTETNRLAQSRADISSYQDSHHNRPLFRPRRRVRVFGRWNACFRQVRSDRREPEEHQRQICPHQGGRISRRGGRK